MARNWKLKFLVIGLAWMMVGSLFAGLFSVSGEEKQDSLTPHAPIYINGNSEFTVANGITGGSGTTSDPYIIENWDIDASTTHGIEIRNTDKYFIIRNCMIHDGKPNYYIGIYFYNVQNGKIQNITSYNNYDGIYLDSSSNNTITNCAVYNNSYGIYPHYSSNNNITNCAVYNNSEYGIVLSYSSNNNITNCPVYNNSYGIELWYSSNNNIIYHNNLINNTNNAYDECSNSWDNGYPSGGNYWSDYTGSDLYSGANQDEPGSDGIGDTPYDIPGGSNLDGYPLMEPWSEEEIDSPDLTLTSDDISFSNTNPVVNATIAINATIHNYGICWIGLAHGNSFNSYNGEWVEYDFYQFQSETVDIVVRATDLDWGTNVPVYLWLDDSEVGNFDITSGSWESYTISSVSVSQGNHTLRVNMAYGEVPRDLYMDWVKIGTLTIEAETYDRTGGSDPNPNYRGVDGICPGNVSVKVYDGNPSSGGTLIAEQTVGYLNYVNGDDTPEMKPVLYIKNNGEALLSINWAPTTAGTHTIYVVADPDNLTAESDETNNEAYKSIYVSGAGLPDLTLSSSDISFSNSTPDVGETIMINATVHNIGENMSQTSPSWDVKTEMNDSEFNSSTGELTEWTLYENHVGIAASIIADEGRTVLRLNADEAYKNWYYQIRDNNIDKDTGFTAEVCLKVIKLYGDDPFILNYYDGEDVFSLGIYDDRIKVSDDTHYMNTTNDYHIYRFCIKGDIAYVYVDDVLVLTSDALYPAAIKGIDFGDTSIIGGGIDVYVDYVYYTTKGAPENQTFYDGFEDGTLNNWVTNISSNASISVVNSPVYNGSKACKFEATGSSYECCMEKVFSSKIIAKTAKFSWAMRRDTTLAGEMGFQVWDDNNNPVFGINSRTGDYLIHWQISPGGWEDDIGLQYGELGTWYYIEVVADFETQTGDVWINSVLKGENLPFTLYNNNYGWYSTDNFRKILAQVGYNSCVGYLDDVKVEYTPTTNVTVKFYDGNPSADGALIGTDTISSLPAGSSATTSINWTPTTTGTHTIYVVVDPDNLTAESDETNNVAWKSISVQGVANQPPVVNITYPEEGQTVNGTITITGTAYDPDNSSSGLVACWHFDENTGIIAHDSSGNNNNGTIYNATWTNGVSGSALSFEGYDYVAMPSSPLWNLGDNYSLELWVNFRSFQTTFYDLIKHNLIPDDQRGWDLYYNNGVKLLVWATSGTVSPISATISFSSETWYHIVVTYDGTTAKIYINDTEAASNVTNILPNYVAGGMLAIGSWAELEEFGADEIIDEVAIYNRALSASEIQAHYEEYTGLVASWHFDENTNTIAHDSSGNNNNGTIYGATWTTGVSGSALSFDGVNDYVNVPDSSSLDITNTISLETWIKPGYDFYAVADKEEHIIIKEDGSHDGYMLVYEDGLIHLALGDGTWHDVAGAIDLHANAWYHIVGTYDGIIMRMFVNGVELANLTWNGTFSAISNNLWIGRGWWNPNIYFNGTIDEVRIYNRALSANEIQQHYAGSSSGVEKVEIKIDNGSWQLATGNTTWSFAWDTTTVSNGWHTIYARAYDGIDYSEIKSVNVYVDNPVVANQPPVVNITYPVEGQTVNGTVTITGTAYDPDGGTGYDIYARAEVSDYDHDGTFDDVWICVWDSNSALVAGASVYINGYYVGTTDYYGDLYSYFSLPGRHYVDVYYGDYYTSCTFYICGYEIYAYAYVYDADSGGSSDDVGIYVYSNGLPGDVSGASVYIDDVYYGTTDSYGILIAYDFAAGTHYVDVYYEATLDYYASTSFYVGYANITLSKSLQIDNRFAINTILQKNGMSNGTTVQSVEIKIDSGSWQLATGTTSWSFAWNTTTVSNGWHTIYARAYDGIDYSEIKSVSVYVDNPVPQVTLSGYVWENTTLTPIQNALVNVSYHDTYQNAYTNETGYYHISNIPLCECLKNVSVSKAGYVTTTKWIGILEDTILNFTLDPVSVNQPPAAVTLYDPVDITTSSMTLTWSENNDADFAKYEIYQSTTSGSIGTLIHTITDQALTTYTVTSLAQDTTYYFIVRVIDTGNLYNDSNQVSGTTLKENQPPTAVILYDPTEITTNSMTLTWTQNTDDDFVKYEVYQSTFEGALGALIYTITEQTATSCTVTVLSPDTTYYFTVKVYDTAGLFAYSNQVSGKTLREIQPPTANFTYSPGSPEVNETIQFNDTSYDSDGTITAWYWEFGDGNVSSVQNPVHAYSLSGTYTVNLTVTDNDGGSATCSKEITIKSLTPNQQPVVTITYPSDGSTVWGVIMITGTASDPDGAVEKVEVKIGDGSWQLATGIADWTYTWNTVLYAGANHTISVRAYDGTDYSVVESVTVYVNVMPVANFAFYQGIYAIDGEYVNITLRVAGEKYRFVNLTVYENGENVVGFISVERIPGTPEENTTSILIDSSKLYTILLEYTAEKKGGNSVWVTVEYGGISNETHYVFHDDETKELNLTYTIDEMLWATGFVKFDASSSYDSDGEIVDYSWDFGDGAYGYGMIVEHNYAPENYTVSLTVGDDYGASNTTSEIINIIDLTGYCAAYKGNYYGVSLHCPADLTITNATGAFMGYNASSGKHENWLPNTTMILSGEFEIYFIQKSPCDFGPGDFAYAYKITGTETGECKFAVFDPGDFSPGDFNPGDFSPGDFSGRIYQINSDVTSGSLDEIKITADYNNITIKADTDKFYSIVIKTQTQEFAVYDIPINSNATHTLSVLNWSAIGDTSTASVNLTIDDLSDGIVDRIEELWNNFNITDRFKSDLTVTLTVSNYNPAPNENISVYVTLRNTGEGPARNIKVRFLVDNALYEDYEIALLWRNGIENITFYWTAEEGVHKLSVFADPEYTITELNENNNGDSITLEVKGAGAVPIAPLTSQAVAIVGGAIATSIVIAAVLAGTEVGKYGFFSLFGPLFVKRKTAVLDQFTRGRIYEHIKLNPGAHYNSIRDSLELGNGTLSYHLTILEKEGYIKSETEGMYKRFYSAGRANSFDKAHLPLSDLQQDIVDLVKSSPGITQKEITVLTNKAHQVISYNIKVLTRLGIINERKEGLKKKLYLEEKYAE